MLRGLCLFIVIVSAAGMARADDAAKQKALKLFGESDKAYKNGDFEHAAALLREAYALQPEPILLYNLARALEGMGDTAGAINAYETYLAAQATIDDRGAIERRVSTLKDQLAAKNAPPRPQPPPPEPPPPPPPRAEIEHSPLPVITIGGGVAFALTGVAFGLFARSHHSDAIDEPTQAKAKDLNDTAQRYATTANVLLVAGGAIAIGGVVWLIVDRGRAPKDPAKVGLVFGPGSIGIAGTLP